MYVFIFSSLFGAGLGLTLKEVAEPLKKFKLVLLAIIANFVLIPALAYALSILLKADASLREGFIIIACCAGAPFLPRLTLSAKGNVAAAAGLMILLTTGTLIFVPVALPFLIPGLSINPWHVAILLFLLTLIPLFLGLIYKAWKPNTVALIKPVMDKTSLFSLIILIIFAALIDYKILASAYGTGVYYFALIFTAGTVLIGFLFGGETRKEKLVMALSAGARNIPVALLVAITNFSEHRVIIVILAGSVVQSAILFLMVFTARLSRLTD